MITVNQLMKGMPKKVKYKGNIFSAALEINVDQEFVLNYVHRTTTWLDIDDNCDEDLHHLLALVRGWFKKHSDKIEVIEFYE